MMNEEADDRHHRMKNEENCRWPRRVFSGGDGKAREDGGLMMEDGEGQARLAGTLAPPGEKRMEDG